MKARFALSVCAEVFQRMWRRDTAIGSDLNSIAVELAAA
jgi:hypothetical protein